MEEEVRVGRWEDWEFGDIFLNFVPTRFRRQRDREKRTEAIRSAE